MKNFMKLGLRLIGVIVFLAVIFLLIRHFQSKPALPPAGINNAPASTAVQSPTSPAPSTTVDSRIEQRAVDIVFTTDSDKKIEYTSIPLLKVTYQNDRLSEVVADGDKIKELVDTLTEHTTNKSPVAAKFEKGKKGFARIVRGEPGYSVDKKKTLAIFEEKIRTSPEASSFEIPVAIDRSEGKENFASKVKEMGYQQLIASFTTNHDPEHAKDENRNENLRVAAVKIDGLIIPPGGKFSFNKIVGPRTEKCGFKKAGVISRGRVVPGLGGGICQVSTTLYRAVLMSGMKIDERHNHSIYDGIDYAERGLDAAVAWGYKDFCFTNTLDIPVLLSCRSGKGSVETAIYAEKKPFDEIIIETKNEVKHPYKVQKKVNRSLKKGEINIVHPGVHGYSIEVYRRITQNGKTREERLSKDRYLTYNRIEESNN